MEENSFLSKIKWIFFNHRGSFSRETFVVTFTALNLFIIISVPLLYKMCSLFLPVGLQTLLALAYLGFMLYALFVLCIKRLHDLNKASWLSILIMFVPLNILFIAYLCLKEGDLKNNSYGDTLEYQGPAFLLFFCYALLGLYILGTVFLFFRVTKLNKIENTAEGVKQMIDVLPKKTQKELKNDLRAVGALFINGQFTTAIASITKSRVVVRGVNFKYAIQVALSQNKKVEIRFSDNSTANVTKLIASDDSSSVQMSVFEMDSPIGTPAKLGEKNRKILERMNAF